MDAGWLQGKQVAITGRLASMSRTEAAELIRGCGGQVIGSITRQTGVLIVGQGGEPLGKDGNLTARLRKARRFEKRGYPIRIVAEEEFLARLGLESHVTVHRLYTRAQVCRILRIPPGRLRGWLRAGLVRPRETVHGVCYFDYRQVSWARTLCDLSRAGVRVERIQRSLEHLRRWLPEVEQPLAQLGLLAQDGALLVRLENGQLTEPTGQPRLDFDDGALHRVIESPAPVVSADVWFDRGCELEQLGRLTEAADAYREALLAGGPDADACFNLANVLSALGQTAQAMERYRQAVEIDPRFAEAWNNLANVLAQVGDIEAALFAYGKALEIVPGRADTHYNLADTLDQAGRAVEACVHWKAYLQADACSSHARYAQQRLAATGAAR
jgi:tetratricopeptide (TPR) repeat protein